jgi:hypothetical protein
VVEDDRRGGDLDVSQLVLRPTNYVGRRMTRLYQRELRLGSGRDVLHVRRDVPLVPERVLHAGIAVAVRLVGRFLE